MHCVLVGLGCCCCVWSNISRCLGVIVGVVAVTVAWNTTNALYEFFVIVLGLCLGLILGPVGWRGTVAVFGSGLSVVMCSGGASVFIFFVFILGVNFPLLSSIIVGLSSLSSIFCSPSSDVLGVPIVVGGVIAVA